MGGPILLVSYGLAQQKPWDPQIAPCSGCAAMSQAVVWCWGMLEVLPDIPFIPQEITACCTLVRLCSQLAAPQAGVACKRSSEIPTPSRVHAEPALQHLCISRERGSSTCGYPALPHWCQPAFSSFHRRSLEEAIYWRYKTLREPIPAEG